MLLNVGLQRCTIASNHSVLTKNRQKSFFPWTFYSISSRKMLRYQKKYPSKMSSLSEVIILIKTTLQGLKVESKTEKNIPFFVSMLGQFGERIFQSTTSTGHLVDDLVCFCMGFFLFVFPWFQSIMARHTLTYFTSQETGGGKQRVIFTCYLWRNGTNFLELKNMLICYFFKNK